MLQNPNFEQNRYSITSTGIYKIGHDSIRLMKWICYYDRSYYENINYYDLMASICKYLEEKEYDGSKKVREIFINMVKTKYNGIEDMVNNLLY